MCYNASTFKDLTIFLPFGSQMSTLKSTLGYCDDIELITKMFWWFHGRLTSMGLPTELLDIMHAGLSQDHQAVCTNDFTAGKTMILLATDKVGAGMNFGSVDRVFQFKASGLTMSKWDQRRGRGGRIAGATSVGYLFAEASMLSAEGLSVENPGGEDPGIIDLIQSAELDEAECADAIFDRWLENPPREEVFQHFRRCCSNCDRTLIIGRDLEWITCDPGAASTAGPILRSSAEQKARILEELKQWRSSEWRHEWREKWPSYGPKALVSDYDLEVLAGKARTGLTEAQIYCHTHIVHLSALAPSLIEAIRTASLLVHGPTTIALNPPPASPQFPINEQQVEPNSTSSTRKRKRTKTQRAPKAGPLLPYEQVM